MDNENTTYTMTESEKSFINGLVKSMRKEVFDYLVEVVKEKAGLNCQMRRNIYCYSCAYATERCYRNEIGCPCAKYKSYKDEKEELKRSIKDLISDYRNRAEELIGKE